MRLMTDSPRLLPALTTGALLLGTLAGTAAPAQAQSYPGDPLGSNTSFATAANFGLNSSPGQDNYGEYRDGGVIGQTYYFKFLDLVPTDIFLGFQLHDLTNYATGPLALYTATFAPASTYAVTPGLYYISYTETTPGYIRAIGQPTTQYDLVLSSSPEQFNGPILIADAPPPAVPEASSLGLLPLGLLPLGLLPLGLLPRRRRPRPSSPLP